MAKTRAKLLPANEVPEFASEAEAAEWYDTHDTSVLHLQDVSMEPREARGMETIAIRISPRELDEIKRRANHLGIGHTTYIRLLINHHVLEEKGLPPSPGRNPTVADPESPSRPSLPASAGELPAGGARHEPNVTGYQAVKAVAREHSDWLDVIQACARQAEITGNHFAGAWVSADVGHWIPGLTMLARYRVIEKDGPSTRAGQRAYYRVPDLVGVKRALSELQSR